MTSGAPVGEMAMFPLGTAHLPGEDVALRVFEPRYMTMFRRLLAGDVGDDGAGADGPMVFGSVLILRGSEVGGGDSRAEHGVAVEVRDITAPPEGGYVVLGHATVPIAVSAWLPDDPHPRALVARVAPEDLAAAGLRRCIDRIVRAAQMTRLILVDAAKVAPAELLLTAEHRARLGLVASGRTDGLDPDDAFWLVARSLPCGPTDRLAMLSSDGLPGRLDVLERVVEHVREVLAFRLADG